MRVSRLLGTSFLLATGIVPTARSQPPLFRELRRMFPNQLVEGSTSSVALGDVDGDGDTDALFGMRSFGATGAQSRLFLNDGVGGFADATSQLPAALDPTSAVALGDVDGDGDRDILLGNGPNVGSGGPRQSRLYLNDGLGVFTDATAQLPPGIYSTTSVALEDLDADGDRDILLGNLGQQSRLYLNDGSGGFTDATLQLPAVSDFTYSVSLGDVDGDLDPDIFLGSNRLYLNDGAGVFTDATTQLPGSPDGTICSALGDVDGDGDLDILLGTFGPACRLLLNDGSGVFTDATAQLPAGLVGTVAVAIEDVDADGDRDIFLGRGALPDRLCLNDGTGTFTVASAQLPADSVATFALALEDLDADGDRDLLLGFPGSSPGGDEGRLYLNDGAGFFTDVAAPLPPGSYATSSFALEDLDADGDRDLLLGRVSGLTPQQSRLYVNNGAAAFTDATAQLPAGAYPTRSVAVADVDGDGDRDILLGNISQQSRLYLNDGAGSFTDATGQIPPGSPNTVTIALADLDGDGDRDIFHGVFGQSRLYLNTGAGVFADATGQLPTGSWTTARVALGDLDGDGDLDAVLGNLGQSYLYLNNGFGTFTNATPQLPAALYSTSAVALGDVDADGDRDILLGTWPNGFYPSSTNSRLHLNDGAAVFTDATTQLPVGVNPTVAVALGDVDGDADPDILLGHLDDQSQLYRNGGTGTFTDATNLLPTAILGTVAVALGDADGDDDLDLLLGNDDQSAVLSFNLTRQLAWRSVPRVGKALTMEVHGAPGGAWALAIALGTANIPLPPLGILRLDPFSLFVAGAGALDPQGRASATFAVPSIPGLVGVSLYWQSGVGPPFSLTNLEITAFTDL